MGNGRLLAELFYYTNEKSKLLFRKIVSIDWKKKRKKKWKQWSHTDATVHGDGEETKAVTVEVEKPPYRIVNGDLGTKKRTEIT